MRRNELYFNLVEKIFENGQKKEFHEIAEEAITQLGEENYDEKKLRNLIYRMKNKGELLRTPKMISRYLYVVMRAYFICVFNTVDEGRIICREKNLKRIDSNHYSI